MAGSQTRPAQSPPTAKSPLDSRRSREVPLSARSRPVRPESEAPKSLALRAGCLADGCCCPADGCCLSLRFKDWPVPCSGALLLSDWAGVDEMSAMLEGGLMRVRVCGCAGVRVESVRIYCHVGDVGSTEMHTSLNLGKAECGATGSLSASSRGGSPAGSAWQRPHVLGRLADGKYGIEPIGNVNHLFNFWGTIP